MNILYKEHLMKISQCSFRKNNDLISPDFQDEIEAMSSLRFEVQLSLIESDSTAQQSTISSITIGVLIIGSDVCDDGVVSGSRGWENNVFGYDGQRRVRFLDDFVMKLSVSGILVAYFEVVALG